MAPDLFPNAPFCHRYILVHIFMQLPKGSWAVKTVQILQTFFFPQNFVVVSSEFPVPRWMSYVCKAISTVCTSYLYQIKKIEAIKSSCAMKLSHYRREPLGKLLYLPHVEFNVIYKIFPDYGKQWYLLFEYYCCLSPCSCVECSH